MPNLLETAADDEPDPESPLVPIAGAPDARGSYGTGSAKGNVSLSLLLKDTTPVARFEDSLWDDLRNFREGSIPQSVIVAFANAIVCGVGAYVYYMVMVYFIELLWETLPQKYVVDVWPEWAYALWIPLITLPLAICLGVTVVLLGEPGDLSYTVDCVHQEAFVHLDHVVPMCVASLFSIVAGGSVGPEAPLVAICAAIGGNLSRFVFKQRNKNVMRKHTLMGMAGGLAAFFGCPLGGSLFALEVCSRFGIGYFEHMMESILCGLLTMCVFRTLTGLVIGPVWSSPIPPILFSTPALIGSAALVGLLGAALGAFFVKLHWAIVACFNWLGLLDNKRAVWRALLGGLGVSVIGMFIPHTMFWGEAEFQTLYAFSASDTLEHVFPTSGLIGFEMDTFGRCLLVGFFKLLAISLSVAGGFRGGFIFPLFAAGCAFGQAVALLFPSLSPNVTCLAFAAGICVAITKTALATTLILIYLSSEQNAIAAVLAASLASLFATSYMPFIKTQISREEETIKIIELLRRPSEQRKSRRSVTLRNVAAAVIAFQGLAKRPEGRGEEELPPVEDVEKSYRHHTERGYVV